jgi:hypothetical protein
MTKSKKILFGIFVLLVILMVAFRWYEFFLGPVKQPLEYSHKVHTEILKCEECHTGVLNSAAAGLPDIKICMGCHSEEPISKSPEEKKLINFIKKKQNIPWNRLYKNPVHVYFSHNRHVSVGKLECEKCHGNMGKMTKPPSQALVSIDMGYCISCHEKNNIDISCIICHK